MSFTFVECFGHQYILIKVFISGIFFTSGYKPETTNVQVELKPFISLVQGSVTANNIFRKKSDFPQCSAIFDLVKPVVACCGKSVSLSSNFSNIFCCCFDCIAEVCFTAIENCNWQPKLFLNSCSHSADLDLNNRWNFSLQRRLGHDLCKGLVWYFDCVVSAVCADSLFICRRWIMVLSQVRQDLLASEL